MLLKSFESVFDDLKRTSLVVLNDFLIIKRFHEPLNRVIEFIKRGCFVSTGVAASESDYVDKAGPIALDLRFQKGAVKCNHAGA